MCGIYGIIHSCDAAFNKRKSFASFVGDATKIGSLRGKDSTGMFQIAKNGVPRYHKLPYIGEVFAGTDYAKRIIADVDDHPITVGHHRSATFGSVNVENAHPFEHKSDKRYVIGVHNGTLQGTYAGFQGRTFAVDSDYAFYRIFKDGASATLPHLEGSMVLVWYEDDGRLRVFSNGQREFAWAYVHKENAMLFASEAQMLFWLADRNGISIEKDIWYPSDNILYSFDPKDVRAYEFEEIEPPKKPVVVTPARKDWNGPPMQPSTTPIGPTTNDGNRRQGFETHQGQVIQQSNESLSFFDLVIGQEVNFYPDDPKLQPSHMYNTLGMVEYVTTDNRLDMISALMMFTNEAIRENLYSAAMSQDDIVVRVMGVSKFYDAKGHGTDVIVVGRPKSFTFSRDDDPPHHKDAPGDIEDVEVVGPEKKRISIAQFDKLTARGCSLCSGDISLVEGLSDKVGWAPNSSGGHDPICPSCLKKHSLEIASS